MPVPLLPPPQPVLMPEPQHDSDSQQDSPVRGGGKQQQQPGKGQQQQKQQAAAAEADVKAAAADSEQQQEAAAAKAEGEAARPAGKGRGEEHDETTAAALLLGMGSKSDSDGGGSAGSSGRNKGGATAATGSGAAAARRRQQQQRGANGAAANGASQPAAEEEEEDEEEEEEEEEEDEEEEEEEEEEEAPAGGRGGGRARRGGGNLRRSARRSRTPAYRASELLGSGSDDEFEPGTKRPATGKAAGTTRTPTTLVPQKSELTLLCERFQAQFGHLQADGSPNMLMLNDVAEALGVPRRRLYDVINVFESIEVMRRVGKLMYEWVGFDHLPGLLEQLAQDETNGVPVEDRIRRAPTLIIVNEQGEEIGSGKGNSHSLWVLSRRLVRMLLKQQGPIALTAAAAVLVGPGGVADPSKHRSQTQITVERRLYDIGSILCSVGLLERIYMKKRQPAFEWIYGWRPGDKHDPPKLPNRVAPADDDAAAALGRAGRKRLAKVAASSDAGKRQKTLAEQQAEAAMAAAAAGMPMGAMPFGMPMAGFGPAMMMPPPGMAMAGAAPGASPAMFMGGMAGMAPMVQGDDKQAAAMAANGMQMAQFFAPPGAFFTNPMMQMNGMPMAMPAAAAAAAEPSPAAPEAAGPAGPEASGDNGAAANAGNAPGAANASAAGTGEEAANAAANGGAPQMQQQAAPPGMMMWHPQMMMNPAMMQQYQMQQAAMIKTSTDQMQQAGGAKPGTTAQMPGCAAPAAFPGMMMAPAGMMMTYPMMQPMQQPMMAGMGGMVPVTASAPSAPAQQ